MVLLHAPFPATTGLYRSASRAAKDALAPPEPTVAGDFAVAAPLYPGGLGGLAGPHPDGVYTMDLNHFGFRLYRGTASRRF